MNVERILAELRAQRDRLQQAIDALDGNSREPFKQRRKPRRHMSADARRRIGLAMKKRWAERKRQKHSG
jgi:hypothetical protein